MWRAKPICYIAAQLIPTTFHQEKKPLVDLLLRNGFVQSWWNCTFLELAAVLRGHSLISHDQHPFGMLMCVCVVWFEKRTVCGLVWCRLNYFDFELLCYYFCLVSFWLECDVNRSGWPQSVNNQVTRRHPHFSTICLISVENCLLFLCVIYESYF